MTLPTGSYNISGSFSIFFEFGKTINSFVSSSGFVSLNTTGNDFALIINPSGNGGINIYLANQGNYVFGSNQNDAFGAEKSKICISYNASTGRLVYYINGSKYAEQTSALNFVGTNQTSTLDFGATFSGELNQYLFAETAFDDAQCIQLTTL